MLVLQVTLGPRPPHLSATWAWAWNKRCTKGPWLQHFLFSGCISDSFLPPEVPWDLAPGSLPDLRLQQPPQDSAWPRSALPQVTKVIVVAVEAGEGEETALRKTPVPLVPGTCLRPGEVAAIVGSVYGI